MTMNYNLGTGLNGEGLGVNGVTNLGFMESKLFKINMIWIDIKEKKE